MLHIFYKTYLNILQEFGAMDVKYYKYGNYNFGTICHVVVGEICLFADNFCVRSRCLSADFSVTRLSLGSIQWFSIIFVRSCNLLLNRRGYCGKQSTPGPRTTNRSSNTLPAG